MTVLNTKAERISYIAKIAKRAKKPPVDIVDIVDSIIEDDEVDDVFPDRYIDEYYGEQIRATQAEEGDWG